MLSEGQKSFLGALLHKIEVENKRLLDPFYEEEEEADPHVDDDVEYMDGEFDTIDENEYRFDFMDPFESLKVYHAQERLGLDQSKILVWPGGVKRISDQMSPFMLNRMLGGGKKLFRRRISFSQIADVNLKVKILLSHTHWGILLQKMCSGSEHDKPVVNWARTLRKRIIAFLGGKSDPIWSKTELAMMSTAPKSKGKEDAPTEPEYELREGKARAERFLQVLRSIDGTFTQIYLGSLTAGWSWSLYDQFVLSQLSHHLSDEFVDGVITRNEILEHSTYYERLKALRGKVKQAFLRNEEMPVLDGEMSIFAGPLRILKGLGEGHYRTQIGAIMVQTRGVGTPPAVVTLKSKMKFLTTVSAPPEPLKEFQLKLVGALVSKTLREIPDHVFTGLTTKAGVNPTTSACLENLREEGGTSEHARSLMREGKLGRKVRTYNLDTNEFLGYESLETLGIGTYLFWRCLEEVLSMTPASLREAKVVMINEPGKARTVTKAHAALKIILDVINGICSYPLKKGVESSTSGMGKSNHGWNAFVSFYENERVRDVAFRVKTRTVTATSTTSADIRLEYEDCWMSFTDYSEATDKMDHKIASFVAEQWMLKCGIPKVLRGIVHETCFKPRSILFDASGVLEGVGSPTALEGTRVVTLRQGVLMGDPLTKVILHLMNKAVRDFGKVVTDSEDPFLLLPFQRGNMKEKLAKMLEAFKQTH